MTEGSANRFSPFVRQCYVNAANIIMTIGHGCGVGFIGILAPQVTQSGASLSLTPNAVSWIASVAGPTLLMGNLLLVPVMSRWGRRSGMLAVVLLAMVGWFWQILGNSFEALMIGRFLTGLSLGMVFSLRAIMCGEYSSPRYRGAFLASITLGQTLGVFVVHLIGTFYSWKLTGLMVTFIFFVSLVMTIFSPETPSFLASKGRYDECREAFRWLRGCEEEAELDKLIATCVLSEKLGAESQGGRAGRPAGLRERLQVARRPEIYKPVILMSHMYFLAQFSGNNVLSSYPIPIIGGLMGPGTDVTFWLLFLDIQRLAMNVVAIFIIDKLRRRTILFWMAALSILTHAAIALYVYARLSELLVYDAAWIPAVLLNMQVAAIGIGLIPVPSVIGGEVFPLEYRSICGSVSYVSVSLTMFVSLKTFPDLIESTGLHGTYMIYALILLYNTVIIWFLMPETKGRTLQEIEEEFRGRPLLPDTALDHEAEALQDHDIKKSQLSLRRASVHSMNV